VPHLANLINLQVHAELAYRLAAQLAGDQDLMAVAVQHGEWARVDPSGRRQEYVGPAPAPDHGRRARAAAPPHTPPVARRPARTHRHDDAARLSRAALDSALARARDQLESHAAAGLVEDIAHPQPPGARIAALEDERNLAGASASAVAESDRTNLHRLASADH